MIYTITLNPAVDRQLLVDEIEFNHVLRTNEVKIDVGGKGFNVSRMLNALDATSIALGFIAGHNGNLLNDGLHALGIETHFISVTGETRTNISITSRDYSRYIKVNEPGAKVSAENVEQLLDQIKELAQPDDWWVISGSIPPGVPASIYAQIIEVVQDAGGFALLDASGEALRAGLVAGPMVVKPNDEEAAELTGLPLDDDESLVQVANVIHKMGAQHVLISLGKRGALLHDGTHLWRAQPPTIEARNPIGAGDSMVAGFVLKLYEGEPLPMALAWGIACGAATASQQGTTVGPKALVKELQTQVTVEEISDVIHG